MVDSLTWETLPGAEETSSLYIVCMESMTTSCGRSFSITLRMISRFVSHRRYRFDENSPIRFALSLICAWDSSPEIYSTFLSFESIRQTCRSSVDFPMPGSPPTRTRDPGTIPPPSTRSSSRIPVLHLASSSADTSVSGTTFASLTDSLTERDPAVVPFVIPLSSFSSTNVFHSPHAGHCPSHFASSCPQFWQKNMLFFAFAIYRPPVFKPETS